VAPHFDFGKKKRRKSGHCFSPALDTGGGRGGGGAPGKEMLLGEERGERKATKRKEGGCAYESTSKRKRKKKGGRNLNAPPTGGKRRRKERFFLPAIKPACDEGEKLVGLEGSTKGRGEKGYYYLNFKEKKNRNRICYNYVKKKKKEEPLESCRERKGEQGGGRTLGGKISSSNFPEEKKTGERIQPHLLSMGKKGGKKSLSFPSPWKKKEGEEEGKGASNSSVPIEEKKKRGGKKN